MRADVRKGIKKEIKQLRRLRAEKRTEQILLRFNSLGTISAIQNYRKKIGITELDGQGEDNKTTRHGRCLRGFLRRTQYFKIYQGAHRRRSRI